jgi:hypothetical protein
VPQLLERFQLRPALAHVAEGVTVELELPEVGPGPGDASLSEPGRKQPGLKGRALVHPVVLVHGTHQIQLDRIPASAETAEQAGVHGHADTLDPGGGGHEPAAEQRLAEPGGARADTADHALQERPQGVNVGLAVVEYPGPLLAAPRTSPQH